MNKDKISSQPNVFFQVNTERTKRKRVEKWIKDISWPNKKSIYDLTWNGFYKELHKLGIKAFLKQYGYSYKKELQLVIAKSKLWQRRIALYDFETSTERELSVLLGNNFFDKVTHQSNFNAKNHNLSTIHYYVYHYSLHLAAVSLGFASKQCFLNFFAQTLYVSDYAENGAQNLRASILSLHEVDPVVLRKELADRYDKPLVKNKNFIKYNYTLEELKLALESEDNVLVVASLGGSNAYIVNKKLQILRPLINVSLQVLRMQSWESLKANTPIFIWKIKLYRFFSGQIPLEQWDTALYMPGLSYRPCLSYCGQFFSSQRTQDHTEERREIPLKLQNPPPFSSYRQNPF
jgi:hypothetical protein